jgi:hypothetical protein
MSRKFTVVVASLALGFLAAGPCSAMSVVPSPLNSDGTPRFTDPSAAPRTYFSGPGQVTTTFGNGSSFSFGVTVSNGTTPGFGNPGFYNTGPSSPYYTGPSNSAFPDQTPSNQLLPNSQNYQGLPFLYVPAPAPRVDPNRPR